METLNPILSDVLNRARKTAFYQDRLPNSSWENIPLTTKSDLRDSYPFGLLALPHRQIASYHESSGTSGKPTASFFTEADWQDVVSRFLRNAINVSENDWIFIKTPYSLVTTAHQMHRAAEMVGATVVPGSNRTTNMSYPKVLRLLSDLPITAVWCLPTEVCLWAKAARQLNLNPITSFPHLRAFLVAGESLAPSRKNAMESFWGRPIFCDYGSTETGSLGGQCSHGNMHLWEDRLYFELVDKVAQNCGSLVVTSLHRQAMPLVRYNLGDVVRLGAADSCGCGSRFRTIEVLGRKESAISGPDGPVFPIDIEEALFSLLELPGDCLWRAKWMGDRLKVEVDRPFSNALAELEMKLRLPITISYVEDILPRDHLMKETKFSKPKYLLSADDSWHSAITY